MAEKVNLRIGRKGNKGERDKSPYRTRGAEAHSSEVCGLQRHKKQ